MAQPFAMDAKKLIDKEKAKEVKDRYKAFYNERGASPTTGNIIAEEEVSAAGAEEVFRNADAWEYILGEEPSLADKVLSFFRKSARAYSSIQGLSSQARKFVREYKNLFDSIAESNKGNNALSLSLGTEIHKKTPVTDTVQENTNVTGDNDEEAPATTNTDVDTDTRFALSKGKAERLKNELVKLGTLSIRLDAGGKRIRILTDKFTQNKNIFSNKGRNMREVNARIKAIPHFAEILRSCTYDGTDTEIHGLENEAKKGVVAMHRFKGSYEGFDIEVVIRDKGAKQFLYEIKFIEKEKSPQQSMTDESVSPAPLGDAENKAIITHSEKKSNTPDENSSNNPPEERFALTDEAYLAAVESGDIEAVERIIRDAAHNAGYTVEAYHGTGADFTVFSEESIGERNVWGKGFYFGTSRSIADDYASQRANNGGKYRIVSAFLKLDNPFIPSESAISSAEKILDKWFPDMWKNYRELGIDYIQDKLDNAPLDLLQFIAEHNHIEIRDVLTEYGYDGVKDGGELVVFSPEQIKSAEPITYDNDGNVIPLSKRFNTENTDIRYALPEALKKLGEYDATRVRHIESSGKDRVVRDYNEIIEFIKHSKTNPPFERLHIGIISDKTATLVKTRTGEDIEGYDFVLASNFVFHIYDSHGNEATEAQRGQKAVDDASIENIIETVIDPDDVILVSDSSGTALRFEKVLEGRNVAITITSTKKSTLTLKSAWIINEKSGGRTPSANANALAGTPEANSRSSTNNSIPENSENSNPSGENFSNNSPNERFALSEDAEAIENYSEEEYNSFGWARYAGAISKSELDDLYSKILARTTLRTFKHSHRGEAIIEVNNKPHTTLNVNNVFVFVKGTKNNFRITRVLRFNAETETEMETIKEALYEGRTCSDTYLEILKEERTAREYRREDSTTFATYREGRSNGTQSRGTDSNNRRSKKYRSGYSLTIGEDGEITERFALTGNDIIPLE